MARLVDLLGTGGGAIAAEVLPAQALVGEDADQAAAFAAHRDGLVVVAVVGGNGDRGERDLERLRVEHAQQSERGLHLVGGGPREPVRALARGRIQARPRTVQVRVGIRSGLGNHG